jgi:hypothetical protein
VSSKVPDSHNEITEPWFDDLRVVDSEWVEFTVTTSDGEKAHFRVPRRTLFRELDEQAERREAA